MLFQNDFNMLTTEEIIQIFMEEFQSSKERKLMLTGEKYYLADNDIKKRKMYRYDEQQRPVIDLQKPNNRLAHSFMHLFVEDKINYLLSRPYTISSDDTVYGGKVSGTLGNNFQRKFIKLGREASNKGIAWLMPYISSDGKFKAFVAPSEQCVPLWSDNEHEELDALIYYYDMDVYEGKLKKEVTKIEYMTPISIEYYVIEDGIIRVDSERYLKLQPDGTYTEVNDPGHFLVDDIAMSWGKVPAIPFKNNDYEIPDIKFIKDLIDDYDKNRSDISNTLDEIRSVIFGLKGYGGQNLAEFMRDLSYYRAVLLDEDGGLETYNPTIDITAAKEHFDTLKDDIYSLGQAVDKSSDKIGNSPSGIALKFLYSGLDLKCNSMESNFQWAFGELMYFVNKYWEITGQDTYLNQDISIVFNRDIQINETEAVTNCANSKGIISDKTIIENHPFVTDAVQEMKQIEEESKSPEEDMFQAGDG